MGYLVAGANLRVEREAEHVVSALIRSGVDVVLIKGPQQGRVLHGMARYASIDIDVLVGRDQMHAAETALAGLGYERTADRTGSHDSDHAHTWERDGSVPVDLHWSLVGADPERLWGAMGSALSLQALGGTRVRVPDSSGTAFLVALHAAQHGIDADKTLCDLAAALVVFDEATWLRASDHARVAGAEAAFSAGLSLSVDGRDLAQRLNLPSPVLTTLDILALETAPPTADGFAELANTRDWRSRLALVHEKLTPPKAFMRHKYPIARRGRIGLSLSYVYRPFWLAWWAPRGYLAARRARKAASRVSQPLQ